MKKRQLIAVALASAAVMFLIGYLIAVRVLFPPLPEPENGIEVPSLLGLSVSDAEARLRPLGLRLSEVSEIETPYQPPGVIIAQSPLAGQQLRDMGSVRIAISGGLPKATLPLAPQPRPAKRVVPDTVPVEPLDTIPPDTVPVSGTTT